MNKQQEELVTQSYLLENGWTKSMIQKFLPDPVLKKNPRYSSAPPMKLWKKEIIEQTMQTDTFLSYIQKTETRKKAAHKAVQTKKEQLMTETESLLTALTVTVLPETILKQKVIEDKKQWADLHDDIFTEPADSETMERWTVNYIRHHLKYKFHKFL